MKILIASLMRVQGTTGVQTHFNALRRYLSEAGDDVELVNSFSVSRWLYRPVYAVRMLLPSRWFRTLSVFWYRYWHYLFLRQALVRRLRANDVDLINAQCPLSAKAALEARGLAGARCRVVLTCHFNISQADEFVEKGEMSAHSRYHQRIRELETAMLAQSDGVVFVSEYSRAAISAAHGLTEVRGVVIHNGVEAPAAGALTRGQLDLPSHAFVLISVGTLEPRKNQHCLVSALIPLLREHADHYLLLVGDGPDRRRIEQLISQHRMQRQIRLLGFRSDVSSLLGIADLYCHPALMESFGLSVVEAMAAGLPVVAAPVGGIPEFIGHLQQGVLVECAQGGEYTQWLRRLLQDDELRGRLARGGLARYRERLTLEAMGAAYRGHFRTCLESAHG